MKLNTLDAKYIARDSAAENIEIVKSDSDYLIDAKGKKFIDFYMGWCVGNIGWGNKQVRNAIKHFNGPDYVNPSYLYQPWAELAELLAKITPGKLIKSFRTTGGTESVEIALRSASVCTGRHKFISIEGSYHGNSIGAQSIGDSQFRAHQPNLLFRSYKINAPFNDKSISQIAKLLKRKDIAAFIMEPVICNLGVIIPKREFMTEIQSLCKEYGTLLIMDEVATGFGRTGKLFACEHFNIEPDILCLAKGLTGGYAAMGATIVTDEVAKAMEYDFSYYSTFGWHPLSVAAALANIHYILDNKAQLLQNTSDISQYFQQRLLKMRFKHPAEIRIIGLAIAIEFKNADYPKQIIETAKKKGLLLSYVGNSIVMFPALNIHKTTAKNGLDILEQCL